MEEGGVRGPGSKTRLGAAVVGLVVGFAIGLVLGRSPPAPKTHEFRERTGPHTRPRPTTRQEPSTAVTGQDQAEPTEAKDDRLLLAPGENPRLLVYDGDEADLAAASLERFLAALAPDRLERQGEGRARIDIVDLFWRIDGTDKERTLRIVALPEDPYHDDYWPGRTIEAIAAWETINGVNASGSSSETDAVTCVRDPWNVPVKVPIGDAAVEEFRARGLDLTQEEVAQGIVCLLARDPGGAILWSVLWEEGGTWAVRHHADPFDTAGEQEVLLAIFRRATGLEPTISPEAVR